MKTKILLMASSMMLLATYGSAQTGKKHLLFSAKLEGAQEVPAVSTPATGVGAVTLNSDTLYVNVQTIKLSSPIISAHLHAAPVGVSGPPVVTLTDHVVGDKIRGFVTGTALTPALISQLLHDSLYLNVHTVNNPQGEIRGQLSLEKDWAFSAHLTGAQEVPAVTTKGLGESIIVVSKDLKKLTLYAVVDSLSDNIVGAHIHAGAPGVNGDVLQALEVNGNVITIEADPTPFLAQLLAGNTYINVHTTSNPNGEIRGQINLLNALTFDAKADGAQEVPAVNTPAKGVLSLKLNGKMDTLWYYAAVSDLSGPITGAHIHEGAPGISGNVLVPLSGINNHTISGIITGTALTKDVIHKMLSGNTYFNVHTAAHPEGEIRGQVWKHARYGFTVSLDGKHQIPANNSAATGEGFVSINREWNNVYYHVAVSGLSEPLNGAHFHGGLKGQNGPVLHNITSAFQKTDTTDHASGWLRNDDSTAFTLLNALRFNKDSIYLNIHNTLFPDGEIRGQVVNGYDADVITNVVDASNEMIDGFSFSPNPVVDKATILLTSAYQGEGKISLFNVLGTEISNTKLQLANSQNILELDMNNVESGIYLVVVEAGNTKIVKRVIKK